MSPFLKIQPNGHPVLLVAFSHIETPPGYFSQYNVLDELPYAKIFLNCPDNSYYLRPIPGIGDHVGAIAARLRAEIAMRAPARVVFFGNSMGAYGALLYGALLGADLTIAMAPEVLLGSKGGAMMWAAQDKTIGDDPHATALPEIVRSAARGQRLCLFGEKAIADMRCALALTGTGATAIGIRNAFHSIAPFFHGTVGLARLIADLVDHGAASALLAAAAGDLFASPQLIAALYASRYDNKRFEGFAHLAAGLDAAASRETLAYAWLEWGRQLAGRGAARQALPFVLAAALTNPGDIEAYALLLTFPEGRRQAGRIDREALLAAVAAHRFDPTLPYCRFLAALQIEGDETPPQIFEAIAAARLTPTVAGKISLHLAQLLLRHGELDRAEAQAQEACARLPAGSAAA